MLVTLVGLGCYAPHPPSGAPCGAGDACPEGLVCSPSSQTCELVAIDASSGALDTASAPDAPADAATTAVLVQQVTRYASSAATLSITLAARPTAGDVLVLIAGNPHAGIATVLGAGATWAPAARSTVNANVEIWVGVTDGLGSTVVVAVPNSTAPMSLLLTEWAGLATTNGLDAAADAAGVTSPASAGAIVTQGPGDLDHVRGRERRAEHVRGRHAGDVDRPTCARQRGRAGSVVSGRDLRG